MIYHLFQLLKEYDIPGQGLMNYLSFRAFLASATAMLFSLLVGKKIISLLQPSRLARRSATWDSRARLKRKAPPPWAA